MTIRYSGSSDANMAPSVVGMMAPPSSTTSAHSVSFMPPRSSLRIYASNECLEEYDPNMDQWLSLLAPQLRALDEPPAQHRHMTRPAERLGIPQSSMSRRIHALEKTLGIRL